MARATKRTSVLLGTLACVFIIIIIVLCVVPRGGSPPLQQPKHGSVQGVITDTTTESATAPSTTPESTTAPATTPETTTVPSTTPQPITPETTTPPSTIADSTTPPSTTADSTTASSTTAQSAPTPTGNTTRPEQETCDSPQCRTVAANMLATMDHEAADKCQDFYQYACGGLMRNPYLRGQDRSVISKGIIKDALAETHPDNSTNKGNMRIFYDSCLDAVDQEPTDGWNQTVQKVFGNLRFDQTPAMDLTDTLTHMMLHDFAPFFDINVDVDQEDNSIFSLTLHPAVPGSPFSEDLASKVCLDDHHQRLEKLEEGKMSYDVQEEYKTYTECVLTGDGLEARLERMEEAVQRFGLLDQLNDPDQTLRTIKENAKKLLVELADKLPNVPELKQKLVNKNYSVMTRDDLVGEVGVIDWVKLMEQLVPDAADDVSGGSIKVQVYMEDSITETLSVLQDHYNKDPTALTNVLLMLWSERLYTDFVKPLGGSVGDEEYCLDAAITLMPDAASELYMDKLGNAEIEARERQVTSIAKSITRAGKKELERDPDHKQDEIDKLTDMLNVNKTSETTEAEDELQLGTDFFDNCIQLLENRRNVTNSRYDNTPEHTLSAFIQPYKPFGVHVYLLSKILIPFGAQEDSSTFNNVPQYLSYAGIGHMISHLVMHGYDTSGVQYQKDGLNKLERQISFTGRMNGLKTQYTEEKSFSSPDGVTLNTTMSDLALNELLADSGATRLAWEAYVMRNDIDPTESTLLGTFGGSPARRRRRNVGDSLPTLDSNELPLPWLGLTPAQLYFLHWAQQYCSATGGMSLLELTESVQPPSRMRVNLVLQNEPLFNKAFQCTPNHPETPFILG